MTSRPPSRVTLPFWLSDRILMPGFCSALLAAADPVEHRRGRRAGDDDDVARAAELSVMYLQAFRPAAMLSVWTCASAPWR